MSTTASFKQQCPSCEAWVPIRDAALIGRKIDCPKCKYRFVVEEPGQDTAAEEAAEEAPPRKGGRKDAVGTLPGKSRTAEKAPGLSSKLLLMIGVGVVALVALVATGIWIFSGGGGSSAPRSLASSASNRSSASDDSSSSTESTGAMVRPAVSLEAVTNMVPPDAEGLCNIRFQSLMGSELGRTIFMTRGAFLEGALNHKLGMAIGDIDLLIQAWNFTQDWKFNIVHCSRPIKANLLTAALQAKAAIGKDKIGDQEYFLIEPSPWLRQLGRMSFATILQVDLVDIPNRAGTVAMRVVDDRTLVFADVKPMQDFLKVKGRFPLRPPEQPKEESKPAETGAQAAPAGGPPGPGNKMQQMMGAMGGRMGAGQGAPPAAAAQEKEAEKESEKDTPPAAGTFLTLEPALKKMLDRVDKKKPVASLVVDLNKARGHVPPLGLNTLRLKTFVQDAAIVGASLQLKSGFAFTLAADYQDEETTIKREQALADKEVKDLAARIGDRLDTKVDVLGQEQPPQLPGQGAPGQGLPGMARFGAGPGGMPQGAMMGQAMQRRPMAGGPGGRGNRMIGGEEGGPVPGGGAGMAAGGQFRPGAAQAMPFGMPGMPGMPGRPGMPGGFGVQPGANQPPAEETKPAGAIVRFSSPDKTVLELDVQIKDATATRYFMNRDVRHAVLQQKGYLDMASGQPRIHDLARALVAYAAAHDGQFPRGTVERSIPGTRANRPFAPNQRVSWMAELLPFLGPEQASLYDHIDRQKSWNDSENLTLAATLIPQYLEPQFPPSTWWVRYPGVAESVAATHFVGVAGIGMDAPEYDANNPKVANRLGIFGYDRATRIADIKDGPANTIMVLQVPPTLKRPWIAGGGSTVQGVPERNCVQPFVCIQRDGKPGTLAIMADGTVRFISADMPDDVFKALCTYKGGELININRDAPAVYEQQELKTAGPNS